MKIAAPNPIPSRQATPVPRPVPIDRFNRVLERPRQSEGVSRDAAQPRQAGAGGLGQQLPRLFAECQGNLQPVCDLPLHVAAMAQDAVYINGLFMDAARLRTLAAARECQLPSRVLSLCRW